MTSFYTGLDMVVSVVLIVGLAYYSIRLLGRRSGGRAANQLIRVVSAQSLGANKTLQVVVVDEKTVLLVGVGANVDCLARFDDQEMATRLLATSASKRLPVSSLPFSWIKDKLSARRAPDGDFSAFLATRMERLKGDRTRVLQDLERDSAHIGQQREDQNQEGKRKE